MEWYSAMHPMVSGDAMSEVVALSLVVRERNCDTPPARAQAFFIKIVNAPERRFMQSGEATLLAFQKNNRRQLCREVQMFLID
jgi:hypothetical protein